MIQDRPKRLAEFGDRVLTPGKPFAVSWDWIPEIVRVALMTTFGVMPVTSAMFAAAGGNIAGDPTEGEIEYFRRLGTEFQMIQIVLSLAWWEAKGDGIEAVPFAISALPASERGKVSLVGIDSVSALKGGPVYASSEEVYVGFDPFIGEWGLYLGGGLGGWMASGTRPIDEMGLVIERYFLATSYDRQDILESDAFMPDEQSRKGYRRNRAKKLYTPYKRVETRRLWGLQSPIELFLFQELLSRGVRPQCQYLIYPDGRAYQSLYDMYADVEFRQGQALLTEADMFLPEERLAIFCDGAHHDRGKEREKDAKIDAALQSLGIRSVRVPGRQIIGNLKAAGDRVCAVLAS